MSHLLDDEDDDLRSSQDRELTLSTTAILGIFFGLVLLCGLFFAFGYNMGSHHNAPTADSTDSSTSTSSSAPAASFNSFKPAAGSPAGSTSSSGTTYPAPASSAPAAQPTPASTTRSAEPAPTQHAPIIVVDHSTPPPTPAPSAATGTFVVQVAAVSPTHQEDADMIVSDLHAKGYTVAAHTSPADQLIHIQLGPFSNRPAAEAMRQRLQTDGYNAFIK